MLRMTVTTEDRKSPEHDRLVKLLQTVKSSYVTIGFHEDAGKYPDGQDIVTVALANEFGADIPNAFGHGVTVHIPERSFVRSAIDGHQAEINEWQEEALLGILEKGWTVKKALDSVGFKIQVLIQNKIQSDVPPANAPSVSEKKLREGKADRTLMDSRLMLRSVTYRSVVST